MTSASHRSRIFSLKTSSAWALLYGGNFAVRRDALDAIGGFDTSIEFHGEDTNLGRRLAQVWTRAFVRAATCSPSARRVKVQAGKRFARYVRTSARRSSSTGPPTPPTRTSGLEWFSASGPTPARRTLFPNPTPGTCTLNLI
jgi:hypothetical protein